MSQCNFIKSDGKQCQANALVNDKLCFTHNPRTKEEKLLAVIRGGKSHKKNYNPLSPIKLNASKDVINLLTTTIGEVRKGEIDLRVANCLGFLAGHLIKALELADLEPRVAQVERLVVERINYQK